MDLSNSQAELNKVLIIPESNWYKYTLACSHEVYTRVRLKYSKPGREYHHIRCPKCKTSPTSWVAITDIEAVSDEHVSNVRDGTSFVLPNRIMRLENGGRNGNPFPYTTRNRDY